MISVFWNEGKGKATFTSLKEVKSFLEKLSENGQNMLDAQAFTHVGKFDWAKDFTHEVHWTSHTDMFSIQFENEAMARAFYGQMSILYQSDWRSLYLFEHLGQGRLARLRYAVKV